MKITLNNGIANIYTPYNRKFIEQIKRIDSKWNAEEKCWTVKEDAIDVVRQIMMDVYGETDEVAIETVNIKVKVVEECSIRKAEVMFLGKTLSRAFGRDTGAKVGEDVYYLEGGCTSGGSMRNWTSIVKKGSVIELRNVNKNLVNKFMEDKTVEEFGENIEIIETGDKKVDTDKLKAEKEALLKRLAEIDDLLGETTEVTPATSEAKEEVVECTVVEKATSQKQVMGRAWTLAREAAKLFDDKVTNYFSACLKQAWEEFKMHNLTLKAA